MNYRPKGVCSQSMDFEVNEDNIITSIKITGGCSGNLQGICKLVTGMHIDDVIQKLDGIACGFKSTSCPDQLAQALKLYKSQH